MHTNHSHPHHAPCWVGGLMDPVFLRHAVNDAEGKCHVEHTAQPSAWAGWQAAARKAAAFFKRPLSGR